MTEFDVGTLSDPHRKLRIRPTLDETFLAVAETMSQRSTCTRCKVGAVVVRERNLVSEGYNDAPPGETNCGDGGCPRGRLSLEDCPRDSVYDNCVAVHAEANAIIRAGFDRTNGATLYTTREPCHECARLIKAAGIARVVVKETS